MKNTVYIICAVILLSGCNPSSSDPVTPTPAPITEDPPVTPQKPEFWLEPADSTLIGQGQIIDIFAAVQKKEDPFPVYIDRSQVIWGSTNPAVASITSDGVVLGVSEGQTTVSASYQSYSMHLSITVSGQMIKKNINIAGQGTRTYYIYRPGGLPASARPLLISMHGGGGNGMLQASMSQLNKTANDQKFYMIYPEGTGAIKTFNGGACCGSAQTFNVNDVDYISKVLDDVQSLYLIDLTKIYATGFSNGGIMSHRLACQLASRISGIAAVGAGSGQFDNDLNQYYACNPTRPIPILQIHALNDRNFPYNGGTGGGVSGTNYYPVPSTVNDWLTRNNLTTAYTEEKVSMSTTCFHYTTINDLTKASAKVSFCKVNPTDIYDDVNEVVYGGGHSWPGGVRSATEKSDIPLQDFKASDYLWSFLNP